MKKPKYSLAYVQALQVYCRVMAASRTKPSTLVNGSLNSVTVTQGATESYQPEDVSIVQNGLLPLLSHRAAMLCHTIMDELEFNNALWYFDHTKNKRDLKAVKELREKGVILPTEDTRIHYINPDKIRKGNKLLVAANTAAITATGRVDRSMIRPLNKKNIQLNPLHLVELGT